MTDPGARMSASLENRRVLVTGGAGFVGSNLVARLIGEGARVTVFDDLFTGRRENLPEDGFEFVQGSVCDARAVDAIVARHEIVFHCAARNIVVSTRNPREDFETNIGGTLNVLLAARASGVERVIYTSSTSVYGNPRYLPINEDDHLSLLTPYAVSKLAGENYCMAFYESYGLAATAVRYSNIFGPGQDAANPYCGVVAKFIGALLDGKPPMIHGDGDQTRDFTFIADAVDATVRAATSERAEILIRITGSSVMPERINRRDVDNIRRRVVNIEKTRRALRWVPEVRLEEGLRLTLEWQRRKTAARERAGDARRLGA